EIASETGNTGKTTAEGWPIIEIPPGADLDDPRWEGIDLTPKPPVLPKTPDQQLHHLLPPQGYNLDLVVSEPEVQEPAAISFDGNGRMFVVELRTYMQDADAGGEEEPIGRISRHEDTNNDGKYDSYTVFVDGLVFPRFALPLGGDAVLTMESHQNDVYKYTDTNGDGTADSKELFASDFGRAGNVEHQPSGLVWGMDNWLYSTYNSTRLRWTPAGETLTESTGSPGGAWGVTMDDYGKTWVQGGASGVPGYFQFPIVYGDLGLDRNEELAEGFVNMYGAPIKLADMQGGMKQVRMPDGSLTTATGGSGNDIFRGHRLPEELKGDYFYGEIVARVVRRVKSTVDEGLTQLHNANQEERSEFIRSTDPLFRPVEMATAPDGTLYIVDMYRGIIQQGTWTDSGSYLRTKIEQYQLDKIIRHGRIWRLTHESMERDQTQPRMLDETPSELVAHLDHPNGWWRDTAQQLLVLAQDKSVVPELENIARTSDNELARFHAMWTLEGLGSLKASMLREFFSDENPQMRLQAIRASETLYKYGDQSLEDNYRELTEDENVDVAIQAMMTLNLFDVSDIESIITTMQEENSARGIKVVGDMLLEERENRQQMASSGLTQEEVASYERGATIYANLCTECHGSTGLGVAIGDPGGATLAPPIINSSRIQGHEEYVVKTIMHGMAGPINGTSYGLMAPMGMNTDEWIADIATYIRNSMGNSASVITPEYVAEIRESTSDRNEPYVYEELRNEVPKVLEYQEDWEVTASHSGSMAVGSSGQPTGAFSYSGWTTGQLQEPDMWFQIELPEAVKLTEVIFNSPSLPRSRAKTF
ncbi:MAG: c-type cytochrome, partial [Balneolales bacterium]